MFYDLDDNPIASFTGSIDEGEALTYELKIDCRVSRFLAGDVVADLALEGRAFGEVSWVNLETTRIDLTPYANTRQRFQIRVTAASITVITRRNFQLRIEP